jgi:YjbE family integral membrane protein
VLIFFTVSLLRLPFLKVVGTFLLLWIGVKLLLQGKSHDANKIKANTNLLGAVKTIVIVDFVMSLDNVLGVVAAAHGNVILLVFGLLVSIPLIAWSSQLVLKLIYRFPFIIYAGGGLLGYVAGEMFESDANVALILEKMPYFIYMLLPAFFAVLVVVLGMWLNARKIAVAQVVNLADKQLPATINGKQ